MGWDKGWDNLGEDYRHSGNLPTVPVPTCPSSQVSTPRLIVRTTTSCDRPALVVRCWFFYSKSISSKWGDKADYSERAPGISEAPLLKGLGTVAYTTFLLFNTWLFVRVWNLPLQPTTPPPLHGIHLLAPSFDRQRPKYTGKLQKTCTDTVSLRCAS